MWGLVDRRGAQKAWSTRPTNARCFRAGPKVVAIGGGTGLACVLTGLKEHSRDITAIVSMADDGGSSGKLRQELGINPPGDIRKCLIALADEEPLMSELLEFRFPENELGGHNFGNLFLTALGASAATSAKACAKRTGFSRCADKCCLDARPRGCWSPRTEDDTKPRVRR